MEKKVFEERGSVGSQEDEAINTFGPRGRVCGWLPSQIEELQAYVDMNHESLDELIPGGGDHPLWEYAAQADAAWFADVRRMRSIVVRLECHANRLRLWRALGKRSSSSRLGDPDFFRVGAVQFTLELVLDGQLELSYIASVLGMDFVDAAELLSLGSYAPAEKVKPLWEFLHRAWEANGAGPKDVLDAEEIGRE